MVATLLGEELGRDPATITVTRIDSLSGMPSQSPVGSRMAIVLGRAVRGAAGELKAKLTAIAAHNLGMDVADLDYADGDVVVTSAPEKRLRWDELVAIAHRRYDLMPPETQPGLEIVHVAQVPRGGTLAGPDGSVQMYPCYSFEAHIVLAAIDPGTGVVDLDRYYLAHDCGTVINPGIVRGMVYGGVAHGIGAALYEQFAFDDAGQPLTQSFMDYLLPSAHEIPDIADAEHCTPSPYTSFGQKGVGEAGYMGAPAAVANAVNAALAGGGAPPIHSLPITPSDVWAAVHSRPGATS